ncbi:MAG: lytic transglycosylase domain-containing protein [Acidobacteriota bacterium]
MTLSCGVASVAAAEVTIKTLPDGTRLMVNESPRDRAQRTAGRLLPVRDAGVRQLIQEHAVRQGLPSRLLQAVMQVESGYNPRAKSSAGAMGLMQLMPGTARELGVGDPWDPAENVRGGAVYLRRMLDHFNDDLRLALAAYNAGPGAVTRYRGVPPYRETRAYVAKILDLYRRSAPAGLRELARDGARQRRQAQARRDASERQLRGSDVELRRGADGRLVLTNASSNND